MKSTLTRILFGAIDGLLFGIVIDVFRRTATPIFLEYYLEREIEEASRLGTTVPLVTRLIGGYFDIPLLSFLIFALVIPIVWPVSKRLKRAAIRWQICGMVAAVVLVLIHNLLNPFGHHLWLLGLKWRLLLSLMVVCFTNLIYGLALEAMGCGKQNRELI